MDWSDGHGRENGTPGAEEAAVAQGNPGCRRPRVLAQVRLWISGHTHTPATNDSFAAPEINMYGSRIMNIHNSDMDRKHIWTNSLYIYGDHIDIRTFDHRSQDWIENYDRQIRLDD